MDERVIRRLLFIFLASLVAIILFKYGMTKTYITLNKAAAEKKQAATTSKPASQQAPEPSINVEAAPAAVSEAAPVDVPAAKINGEAQ